MSNFIPDWHIKGQFLMSCNCDVWCPCVLSMGKAMPTYTRCLSWWCIHIDEGFAGNVSLGGLTVGLMLETPGPLAEGGWSIGVYLDEKGTPAQDEILEKIFLGQAGGAIGWFSIMIAEHLGTKKVPITYTVEEDGFRMKIPGIVDGHVQPVMGADGVTPVIATNTNYWAGKDVWVARGTKSRVRDWGRNWDLTGQSSEYALVDWTGPEVK